MFLPHFAPPAAFSGIPSFFPPDEDYRYDLGFLWFSRAAQGRLRLRRVSRYGYRADLTAETKGVVGLLTAYRKNSYASEMEYEPTMRRLVTRRFVKVVTWGRQERRSVTETDYEKREHRWVVTENGKTTHEGSEPIPKGVIYEDLISAFFNLRIGAFGPLTRGRHIAVISQPYSQSPLGASPEPREAYVRRFVIRIADQATENTFRRRFGRTGEKGLLVLVNVPNDFFGQNTGDVLVWFDPDLVPVAVRVEDVILFGDVYGTLRKVSVGPPVALGSLQRVETANHLTGE